MRGLERRDAVSWDPSRKYRFVTGDGTALHVETSGAAGRTKAVAKVP